MSINDNYLLKPFENSNVQCFGLVESEGTSSKSSMFKTKANCQESLGMTEISMVLLG